MSRLSVAVRVFVPIAAIFALLVGCGEDTPSEGPASGADTTVEPDVAADLSGDDTADAAVAVDVDADASADVPPEDVVAPDPDVAADTPEVEVAVPECPGGAGCDCDSNDVCDSNKCLDTPEGKKCAQMCAAGGCPNGYSCKQFNDGGDPVSLCLPNFLTTCSPCQFNADCQANGADAWCISYGSAGKFCGGTCTDDASCPSSYECIEVTDEGSGKKSNQCKLKPIEKPGTGADCSTDPAACAKGESCVAGKCAVLEPQICQCSAWAKQAGLKTTCTATEGADVCSAERKCTPDGLEACKAKVVPCFEKAYKAGSGKACTSVAECEPGEECNGGKCDILIGTCFGKSACNDKSACGVVPTPKPETCNSVDDNCNGQTDEGFEWTSPEGKLHKVNESCGVGECGGGTVLCKDGVTPMCSTAIKSGKETCDSLDNDCNGKTDDATCDDSNPCTDDVCDSAGKSCSNPPNVSGCDDKNGCTLNDVCEKGQCVGAVKDCDDKDQCTSDSCDTTTGTCGYKDYVGSCSDDNACSVGDSCGKHPTTGVYACLPGKDALKCDDSIVCTDDVCDTQKGCINTANAETQSCYSGPEASKGVGLCKAGLKTCVNGVLDGTCSGEVVPAKVEQCDGKDDNCNGQTDEGCKPTTVAVTFSSAYVSGKSGNMQVQMLVGPSGPVGKSKGTKYDIDFGFLAWLISLVGGGK